MGIATFTSTVKHAPPEASDTSSSAHGAVFERLLAANSEEGDIARQIQAIGDEMKAMTDRIRRFLAK